MARAMGNSKMRAQTCLTRVSPMPEPLAYLNDRFLPAEALTIRVTDAGFVQGVTVAEQLRTFHGELFGLVDHLARLQHS